MTFSVSRILFDLDGTLIDTSRDLTASLNYALESAGFLSVGHNSVKDLVGYGALALLQKGLALQSASNMIDPKELLPTFLNYYSDNIADHSMPYKGCIDLLNHLKSLNISIGICTNKPEKLAKQLIEALGLAHHFDTISGGDTFDYKKPDPRHLTLTADRLSDNGEIVMVGDSITDIKAAHAAEIPSIGVTYGYSSTPMADLEPTKVVDSLAEIIPLINRQTSPPMILAHQ